MAVELLDMELLLSAHAEGTAAVEGLNVTLGDSAAVMERLTAVSEQMANAMNAGLQEARALAAEQAKLAAATDASAAATSKLDERLAAQRGTLASHKAATDSSASSLESFGKKAELVTAVVGVGLAAGIYEAVKKASEFQKQMTMVHTQAGAWNEDLGKMGAAVLKMAGETGQGATELALGLYHIESAGFRGQTALDMLREAAKLATIGNAGLEESSQAVVAVLAAYGEKTYSAAQAAALLNSIVGSGDMRMSQLAKSLATGILPAADTFGLKLLDVGAALATLTDNVTPADEAATRLRMSFSLLGAPSGAAAKALQAVGLSADEAQKALADRKGLEKYGIHLEQLAADMHKPNGLLVAITDLKTHLESAGLTADAQAAVISKAFGGGRTSAGIMTLLTQYDRFSGKYGSIEAGASKYDDSWTQTKQTFDFQKASVESSMGSLSISLGLLLLPILGQVFRAISEQIVPALQRFLTAITPIIQRVTEWAKTHQDLVSKLVIGAVIFAALVLGLMALGGVVFMVAAALGFLIGPAGLVLGVIALLALGALLVITHWKQIEPLVRAVTKVWTDHAAQVMAAIRPFLTEVQKLFQQALAEVTRVVREALKTLAQWWHDHGADVMQVVKDTWDVIHGILAAVLPIILVLVKAALTALVDIVRLAWQLVIDIIRLAWDLISGILAVALDLMLGHWDKAWQDAKRLVANVWDDIRRLVGDAIHNVLQLIIDLKDRVPELAGAIGNALRDGIVAGINQVLDKVHGFIDLLRKLPGLGGFPQVPQHLAAGGVVGGNPGAGSGQLSAFAAGGVFPIGAGGRTNGAMAIVGEGDGHEYVIPAGDRRHRQNAVNLWMQAGRDLQMLAAGGIIDCAPVCSPAQLGGPQMGAATSGMAQNLGGVGQVGGWGGQCVVFVEKMLGTYWPVGAAKELTRYVNSNVARPGEAAVFTGGPYGHVALVTGSEGPGGFPVIDSNWVGPETIGVHTMNRGQYGFSGFIDTGKPLGTLAGMIGGGISSLFNLSGLIDGVLKGFHLDGLPSWLGSFPQEILKQIASGAANSFTPNFSGSSAGATVSFDEGGWLLPGMTGKNLGSQPERVLSPPQDRALTGLLERLEARLEKDQDSLVRIERILTNSQKHLASLDGAPTLDARAADRRNA